MRLPSIRLGRSIVLAMLAVVVSYSGSLWYSQWKMRFVSGQAGRIIDVATQGIQRLGDARTELRRLGMYASEYAVRSDGAVIVTEEEIRATRDRLDEELSAFTALPALEGEVRLSSEISRRLRTLDAALEELWAPDRVPPPRSRCCTASSTRAWRKPTWRSTS